MGDLHTGRESNEVSAQTEAGTLSGSNANTGADSVQDSEHNGGENSKSGNLIHGQGALGDKDSSGGNN